MKKLIDINEKLEISYRLEYFSDRELEDESKMDCVYTTPKG